MWVASCSAWASNAATWKANACWAATEADASWGWPVSQVTPVRASSPLTRGGEKEAAMLAGIARLVDRSTHALISGVLQGL